jgi:ATP-dependent Lon protease
VGAKQIIYPKDNNKDFNDFMEKYENKSILNNITFHEVENINEVLDLVLDK